MNIKINTSFNDVVFKDGWYYGASNKGNALYKFNEKTYEIIGEFPTYEDMPNMYMETKLIGDDIYFTPSSSNYISVYNIKESIFHVHKLKHNMGVGKFHYCYENGGYLYFLPFAYDAIVKYNITTEELEEIKDDLIDGSSFFTYVYPVIESKQVFKGIKYTTNGVYNIINSPLSITKDELGNNGWFCGYYCYSGREYYLKNDRIIIVDNNERSEIELPSELSGTLMKFLKMDNYLFIFPVCSTDVSNYILAYDMINNRFINDYDEVFGSGQDICNFAKLDGRKIVWDSFIKEAILSFDFDTGHISTIKIQHDINLRKEFKEFRLHNFIDYILKE